MTVIPPEGYEIPSDLNFTVTSYCVDENQFMEKNGVPQTNSATIPVPVGSTQGEGLLAGYGTMPPGTCSFTFVAPAPPAGFAWDGGFQNDSVVVPFTGMQFEDIVGENQIRLIKLPDVPESSPTPTEEPSPEPTTPEPTGEPTSPVPSPSVTDEPSPEPTTPGPSPTEEPSPEPTTPEPTGGPISPGPRDPSATDPAPDSPVVPGAPGAGPGGGAAGPGAPGSTPSSGAGGVDVKTGFDRVVSDSRTWWVVAGLTALGGAAGVSAAVLRRRSRGR